MKTFTSPFLPTTTDYNLPTLPYSKQALAPYMSEETLNYHYGKHLQAYLNNLKDLSKGTPYENEDLVHIIQNAPEGGLLNNAGQVMNHTLFFLQLSPTPKQAPEGKLAAAIARDFESLDNFKQLFNKAAATLFGSGWAWLSADEEGKLHITQEKNGNIPLRQGWLPLLCIDVWEHAYYLDYQNARPKFIEAIWNLIDWSIIEGRFALIDEK